MAIALETPTEAAATTAAEARALLRIAAIAGIAFPTMVLIFNILAGSPPPVDASVRDIAEFIADKRVLLTAQVAQFAVAFPCLFLFTAGFYGVLRRRARNDIDVFWARTGLLGAVTIAPLF